MHGRANWTNRNVDMSMVQEDKCKEDQLKGKTKVKEVFWSPPPKDWIKLNFDGSKLQDGRASVGFVIRNDEAKVIMLGAKSCGHASILVAEALALKEGIKAALFLGSHKIEIEGDNFNGEWAIPWQIRTTVEDIKQDLKKFEYVSIRHIFREANSTADFIANKGHFCPSLSRWFVSFSHELCLLIRKDELGLSVNRV